MRWVKNMAEYDSKKQAMGADRKKKWKEAYHRLTAPAHIAVHSYKEHDRIEGYYEFKDYGHIFKCDRLLKIETVYGRVQMGYNPNRGRSFVFANMKTNLYDTVNSRYQQIMKEYQQRPEQKKGNENITYVSGRWKNAAVLLEKAENKPWSERSMEPYLYNTNMETILKTMPFLSSREEKVQLQQIGEQVKDLQQKVSDNAAKGQFDKNRELNQQIRELGEESNMLQSILYRKDSGKRGFIRKINYAFDIEKKEMFDYYRQQRVKAEHEQVEAIAGATAGEDGDPQGKKKNNQNDK